MRITSKEISGIVESIDANCHLSDAQLRLYGSRLRDDARGGDIDLLLVVSSSEQYNTIIEKKILTLVDIKTKIGDQKIDLMIARKNEIHTDPFIDLIYESSQILHQWT